MRAIRYRRRYVPIMTVSLLLTLGLAACSSEQPVPAPVKNTTEPALIRFVASEYSTETKPMLESLVREFERNNPTINVELQVANWDILDGIYTTMISNNQPPDLLNTNVYAHFAADGLLSDMNDILSPELKDKLYPNLMEMDQIEGKQYAIPYVASIRSLYYNKSLFAEARIAKPPATWDELKSAAQHIKANGQASGFGVDLTDNEIQAYLSYFFLGAGGGWIKDGAWAINSPENVEGLTFLKGLYQEGLTDPEPTVTIRDEKQRILGDGKLGMMISGTYFATVVPREFPNLDWGVGPIPVKAGQAPLAFGVHDVLVSFKTDHTNTKALSKFLDFLYDSEIYQQMVVREGFLPVKKDVGSKLAASDPYMKESLDALAQAKFYPVQQPEWQAIMDKARKLGSAVLLNDMAPQEALDQLQEFAVARSKMVR
ncbi:multiple sugar transport system substrate-binding protein [Paenibacillus phyllosphaerae]|uniref:Multiple sugar transport system substrate-binding protein n=1 Tax=Paenibacillus phyllosphaerae TaxID=274593 RepID=A0A7W5FKM4_9BACL|nr:extracellular solute-binding protein [Paenibacillus phyllosphaerae]MBB3108325.1 multiple sugar transport system substrate-binding protein [Paenibacillus phyllosphaerae]